MKYIDHNSSRNPSKKPEMIPTLKKVSKKKDPVTCLLEKKRKIKKVWSAVVQGNSTPRASTQSTCLLHTSKINAVLGSFTQ